MDGEGLWEGTTSYVRQAGTLCTEANSFRSNHGSSAMVNIIEPGDVADGSESWVGSSRSLGVTRQRMSAPLVSVVMPVFNGEPFLREAVESIRGQTFGDFEFIIVDDGSTDCGASMLEFYEKEDERVRVYHQENRGLVAALNRGCELARGKYIARMDADDVSVKERLRCQVEFMNSSPNTAVVGGAIETIDSEGRSLGIEVSPLTDRDIKAALGRGECPFAHPTVVIRKDVFVAVNGYREVALHAEDYDLWTRIADESQLANLAAVMLKYRRHSKQVSIQRCRQQALSALAVRLAAQCRRTGSADPLDGIAEITPETLAKLGISERVKQSVVCRAYVNCIRSMCDAHDYSKAFEALRVSYEYDLTRADSAALVDLRLARSRVLWHQKEVLRSIVTAVYAFMRRPMTVGRPLKSVLRLR